MLMPSSVTIRPERKSVVPMIVDSRMFFSTIFPKKAAPMPRKKMPNENAHWTSACVLPIWAAISEENLVNA